MFLVVNPTLKVRTIAVAYKWVVYFHEKKAK